MQVRLGDSPVIPIAQGQGVTITFIPSRQIVQKVWLDNPTWLTVDADGCLEGLGTGSCDESNATSLHLRRIKPLPIEGLPTTGTSLLTVISRDASGDLKISTFNLVLATSAQHSLVEVVPASGLKLPDAFNPVLVQRGRDVAISQGWLRESSRLSQKIDQFLALSQTEPTLVAAERAGISMALIERLSVLGAGLGERGELGRLGGLGRERTMYERNFVLPKT
jgi:hypothetical protein